MVVAFTFSENPSSLVTNYPGSLASPRLRKVPPAAFLIVSKQSFFLRILLSHQHPLKEGGKDKK